jgi:hypothetical protein
MTSLAIAFSVVCVSLAFYVGWLGMQQRRLAERLRVVQSQLQLADGANRSPAKAAKAA